ncbi:DUF1648 domain-containing protein [Erythrobacter sp. MTPC3]|uniref:DUF1648 domain-containing protein n=1 Tax=Erythrobacter sp. MTPC3 TaxID=3056564 RepID=UPI0036F31FDA
MVSGGALLVAAAASLLLILSGLWAEKRFASFDRLPAHFNGAGKPTRFASRRLMIWLTPVIFIALITLVISLLATLPENQINGDPDDAVVLMSTIIIGAQAFILWLTTRWARGQE